MGEIMSQALSNVLATRRQNQNIQAQANSDYYMAEAYQKQGMAQEQNILSQTKAAAGSAEASAAGSGVVFNEGSALDNIKRTVYQGTKDALEARSNAYTTAGNYAYNAKALESSKTSALESLVGALSGGVQDYQTYSAMFGG